MDEGLGPTTRRARRKRRLGSDARCRCGEVDPLVLQHTEVGVECASCEARRATGHAIEKHHPAGRANAPTTIALDANLHARLSDAQRDWPLETLRNPRQNDALRAAAMLRAMVDGLRIVVLPAVPTVEELIAKLEALNEEDTP